ncbi:MAG: TetR/AcrR family transcriptional regulator [Mixta calida]|nr:MULTISPECIES: TetR/AcrR family transcriptional regulator [Mixta]MDU3815706.1 TetR/AcrR family transcriptional regulator [Pantoea sp.]MCR1568419.1 TetR/AcrR family transcriptional regulator [Mixta sp.]MDU3076977.1 TetR/AcrR family transcriptional regulator [Mixta calida]MDU4290393.1 TetR/AcrR family transcriptional regulator [Mixta calida]MDU4943445.1 TetR/AcrR family transcriptional regulator [Mixta calida]
MSADNLRVQILDGAIALFIEKGIDKVTTRELTEHLGISRSHIYHYFRDWGSLRLEAAERFMLADLNAFKDAIAGFTPDAALDAFITSLPSTHDADWQLYNSVWTQAQHDQAYADLAINNMDRWIRLLESIIAAGISQGLYRQVNVARVARMIGATVNGYADLLSVKPTASGFQEAKEDLRYLVNQLVGLAE